MKPSEGNNETYGTNSILELVTEWNQANIITKRIAGIRMKSNERENKVYGKNSIKERVKEWNQATVITKRMV